MIGVGIIGFGRIGNEHAGWVNRSPNARVLRVFDPTPARREIATKQNLSACEDVRRLLDDPRIDAVLIATPTSMHYEHTLQAIAANKHVMVEKPMALDFSQATAMAEAASSAGRVLSVFQCRRWDIDYLTVKQAVEAGIFGKIFNIESRLGQWGSCVGPAAREYRPNWRNEKAYGGGGLYDWGSHFVDQLWQLFPNAKPIRVFAQLRGNVWSTDCDDFARVVIDFSSGAMGLCEINTTTTRPLPRWHIDGSNGSGDSPFSLDFDTHHWAKLVHTDLSGTIRPIAISQPGLDETAIWTRFASTCMGNGTPAVSVESVLTTMRILDAARQSAASGSAINLD